VKPSRRAGRKEWGTAANFTNKGSAQLLARKPNEGDQRKGLKIGGKKSPGGKTRGNR